MNRIYQGRVTKVEVPDGKDENGKQKWKQLDDWQAALWRHHELFQDAVNYYTLAIAAMAAGDEGDSLQARALQAWVTKVRETWTSATRKAEKFDGPQNRLVSILNLPTSKANFTDAADHVIRSSRATKEQRAAAVMQLLAIKGDLNQICVERLPTLATAAGKLKAAKKAAVSTQIVKRQRIVRDYQRFTEQEALQNAPGLDLGLFQTQPSRTYITGAAAVKKLREYFKKTSEKYSNLGNNAESFEAFVKEHSDALEVPAPGFKPSGLYPVAAVFKYLPTPESLAAFRAATKTLAEGKDKEMVIDALDDARVADQPQFDYFTNIALMAHNEGVERDTRAIWFEFDLAAFIEAIKAPRRYYEDTQKREEAAECIKAKIAAIEGKGYKPKDSDEEDENLPGFEGDNRIELLKNIVRKELAWLEEAEGDSDSSKLTEYTIRERTTRGFDEIKRRWKAAHETGRATEQNLLTIIAEVQTEHREDIGSAAFFRALAKPENHPIWRDSGTRPWHTEDPLSAWLEYKELQADLQDRERPIRFTPAHPKQSPRYYNLPKQGKFGSEHEAGQLSFTAGIVLETDRGYSPVTLRIHYAAPRLHRDRIRANGDVSLESTLWLQPMMEALGLDKPERVNFANCSITLQPSDASDIQLTFPIEINTENIRVGVARESVWKKQFNQQPDGGRFIDASLRWPHEKQPVKAPTPWHQQIYSFSCVAVDLGQRDAGAHARLRIDSNTVSGKQSSRHIGTTDDKQWSAALVKTGMLRLPGEDATIWRALNSIDEKKSEDSVKTHDYREELWGERGRRARPWEADDTHDLMRLLEVPVDDKERSLLFEDWRKSLTFPEQNDKLLVAMRRYQSRMARLHRWCWFLGGDDKQQDTAFSEIVDCDDSRVISPEIKQSAGKRDPRVAKLIVAQLQERLQYAPEYLVRIANRILPLRGRSWRWESHPQTTPENPLHHLTKNGPDLDSIGKPVWIRGQRGLSMKRVEQIEELRKRFQSLNQTMRRRIGDKPPVRRDESVPDPCPELLEKLDNIKEQRVNQTAHMILAEALGLRLAPPPSDKKKLRKERDQHGVYEKILGKDGKWIGPADFIVIENLSRYRASQGRAPRENSRLMKWSHRAIRDKLNLLREVFGIPLLETPAAYSSRFCSRTGVPGFRAEEVTAGFTNNGQWAWLAGKKDSKGNLTDDAMRLLELDRILSESQAALERDWKNKRRKALCPKRTLFVPLSSGKIFVPVVTQTAETDLQPSLVQADINAAINLGLRAISDPRLWSIHPRLRTQRNSKDNSLSAKEKRKFGDKNSPKLQVSLPSDPTKDATKQPNFFADFADLKPLADNMIQKNPHQYMWLRKEWTSATIEDQGVGQTLLHSKSFWGCVKAIQWDRVAAINDARLKDWEKKIT